MMDAVCSASLPADFPVRPNEATVRFHKTNESKPQSTFVSLGLFFFP